MERSVYSVTKAISSFDILCIATFINIMRYSARYFNLLLQKVNQQIQDTFCDATQKAISFFYDYTKKNVWVKDDEKIYSLQ